MSDNQARINVICDRAFKLKAKSAIINMNIDSVQEGYLKLLEIGVKHHKEYKKEIKEEN